MEAIRDVLNSNFLQTLVTLIVGFVALAVYRRQKRDVKKAAANSILLEIQHVESNLPKVKEAVRSESLNDLSIKIMRDDAWSKYSQLFSSDFDKDEWEIITNFYQTARLLGEVITLSNQSFVRNTEEIRINKQRVIADLNKDFLSEASGDGDAERALGLHNKKLDLFDQLYMQRQGEFAYTPVKYQRDAQKYLEDLQVISITTIGGKFKAISADESVFVKAWKAIKG